MATVNKPRSTAAGGRKPAPSKSRPASPMFVELMAAMKSVRSHAAGKVTLKTTTVQVLPKSRRVAAKKAARPSRSRKPA